MILLAETVADGMTGPFESLGTPFRYAPHLARDRDALLHDVRDAVALVVRSTVRVDRELLDAAPGLRAIGRLGVGLDNIDLDRARERSIPVVTAGEANANAVVEYVVATMLHFARPLAAADAAVRRGTWDRQASMGSEVRDKTLAIVGFGRIGRRVGRIAHALGMRVVAVDPALEADDPALSAIGAALLPLHTALAFADVVTLHVPGGPGTHHLIDTGALEAIPRHAVLINAARGSVVDEAALLCALDAGKLRGAALDVRMSEPPGCDALALHPGVFNTPHIGGYTVEAQAGVCTAVATELARVLHLVAV